VTGRHIVHADPDREEWVAAVVASGVPATYGAALRELTATMALEPFFDIILKGVAGLIDGDHFFDTLAEDAVFDYVITVPGYPRPIAVFDATGWPNEH
jgi:hypothetical protein